MQRRRIVFRFGVPYDTPIEQVEAIPRRGAAAGRSPAAAGVRPGALQGLGQSALEFEVVYIVKDRASICIWTCSRP